MKSTKTALDIQLILPWDTHKELYIQLNHKYVTYFNDFSESTW